MDTPYIWKLQKGLDRRFRTGHPWVFSNELSASPKALPPGHPVQLQDTNGGFLAWGYGNPSSLISFRVLSRNPEGASILSRSGLAKHLVDCLRFRNRLGLEKYSYRLCYGEADGVPGLVIDSYRLASHRVFAVQILTAGIERLLGDVASFFEEFYKVANEETDVHWKDVGIVLRNDVAVRKLEGLAVQEPKVIKEVAGINLSDAKILIRPALGAEPIVMSCDLVEGQKTGFFLDQAGNISLLISALNSMDWKGKSVRVLDICSYVGQWGTQLTRALKQAGASQVLVTAADASQNALDFAKKNVEREGGTFTGLKADVLTDLGSLQDRSFDIVICDPPAFIKSKKDVHAGQHAYLKLNDTSMRVLSADGLIISCSCSQHLGEDDLIDVLAKAARRTRRTIRWIAKGTQAVDHPVLTEFPEGRYLKAWVGMA